MITTHVHVVSNHSLSALYNNNTIFQFTQNFVRSIGFKFRAVISVNHMP